MNPALRARAKGSCGLLIALACLALSPAWAAPRLDVTATAAIEIQSIEPVGTQGFRVVGRVVDATTGEPMPALPLTGHIDDRSVRAQTDDHGRFYFDLNAATPPQRIELQLAGHRFVRATPLQVDQPAVNRPVPLISIHAAMGRDSFRVEIRRQVASSETSDPGIAFDLPVAVVASQGDTTIALAAALVGSQDFMLALLPTPGAWQLTANFVGDDRTAPSSATTTLTIATTGTIALDLETARVAADATIVARGKITRADGGKLPPAAIVLMAGEQRLATTQTAADGTFVLRLPAQLLPIGRHALFASLDTPIAGANVAPSPLRWLTVATVAAPSRLGAVLGIALGGLALIAVLWLQLRWRRHQRPEPTVVHRPGFVPAKQGVMQRILRADKRSVGVVIYDAASQRPLAGTVTAARNSPGASAATQIHASPTGGAALELADGTYQLTVSCAGYRPVATSISIPHRGQWSERPVYLVSLRDVLFELYAEAVAPFSELSPNVASPASIFAHVRSKLALLPMAQRDIYAPIKVLTEEIEALYFGDREVVVDDIGAIERLSA
ncbi:MAG: hypothetical protein IPL79_03890 [Myxococcales bacterium]|nr:hypothetical protein [Myxococcales bacterium]